MNVVTGLQAGCCLTNDLSVFVHRLPLNNSAQGDFMPRGDIGPRRQAQAVGVKLLASGDVTARNRDVITCREYK